MKLAKGMKRVMVAVAAATAAGLVMAAPSAPTKAEVRKIDQAASKITLKHGPIAELELPAMTLVYVVRDVSLLSGIKAGDTVQFTADKVDGRYTVLSISK